MSERGTGRTIRDILKICLKLSEGHNVILVYEGGEGARGFCNTRSVANACQDFLGRYGAVKGHATVNGSFKLVNGASLVVSSNYYGLSNTERYYLHDS